MAYADQQMSGNKIIAIIIVVLIHIAIGYTLITGLAYSAAVNIVERVTTVDIDEPEPAPEPTEEPPPPPPEPETAPPPPVAPPPPINVSQSPPQIVTQIEIPPPAPVARIVPPPAPPAPPPPPPPPSMAEPASPRNQSSWARRIQENYPSRALREEIEGTVGVAVTVDAEGRVSSCSVTSSSGSDELDEAACRGMERYSRFNPALDDAGNPTSGRWSTRITYQLS